MNTTNPLMTLLIAGSIAACGGGSPDRAPIAFDSAYTAPMDRIDPLQAATLANADFHALGAARSSRSPTLPATTNQRYVSAARGNDDADGSADNPWKTIHHAAEVVEADTTVWVDDSGDYAGGVELLRGGQAGAWVVFSAAPGTRPRVNGSVDVDAVIHIDASYLAFSGFEITNHKRPTLMDDTIGIRVEPKSGDISDVLVLGNTVHGVGPGVVEEATCYYNGHGIIAQSQGHRIGRLVIDGNEIYDLYVGHSEVLVVNGYVDAFRITNNYIHDVNNIAIDVIGYEKNNTETTSNGYIADNVVLDSSNYWPYCSRGNCTYPAGDESSDGIYVDGGAEMIIEYNVVGRADHGIELQSENGELIRNVEVRFNLVFNSNYKNFTLGDSENSFEHDNQFIDDPRLADATLESCKP